MKKMILFMSALMFYWGHINAQDFTVTVTGTNDNGGCTGTAIATTTRGSSSDTYYWSNGATTDTISGLCAGQYCVTVTDPYCHLTETPCSTSVCLNITSCIAPSCSIASVQNGDCGQTGGNPDNLYLGYGPTSTKLKVSVTGTGPFTYLWAPATGLSCTTCAEPLFTPTVAGNYTFTVTVTNGGGCSSQCSITICVLDVRYQEPNNNNNSCGGGGYNNWYGYNNNCGFNSCGFGGGYCQQPKVYVCHVQPGRNGGRQTICLDASAVRDHIPVHSQDHLGTCNQECGNSERMLDASVPELIEDKNETGLEVLTYPNPFNGAFHLLVQSDNDQQTYDVLLFDVSGKVVQEIKGAAINNEVILGNEAGAGIYFAHIKQGETTRVIKMMKVN